MRKQQAQTEWKNNNTSHETIIRPVANPRAGSQQEKTAAHTSWPKGNISNSERKLGRENIRNDSGRWSLHAKQKLISPWRLKKAAESQTVSAAVRS